jgi:hypothetical protein
MRRLLAPAAVAGLLLVPAVVQAAKPTPAVVTIAASKPTVTYGNPTTLSGQLSGGKSIAGETIDVMADVAPFEGTFARVASATTDAAGRWSAAVSPTALTRYEARAHTSPPALSSTVDVGVRLRVGLRVSDRTPHRGERVRFSGRVSPAHDGAVVRIQRRTSTGAWKTVARTTLADAGDAFSTYAKRVKVRRKGTYRVRAASGDTDHLTGTSRRRTLRIGAS